MVQVSYVSPSGNPGIRRSDTLCLHQSGDTMKVLANGMMETPIYGVAEAAQYLRVPQNTLAYWLKGGGTVPPLINLASAEPPRLSFSNLLECYMLSSMRAIYDVRIPKVRKALITLAKYVQHKHPLIEQAFQTDRRDLFISLGIVRRLRL
jgi:hypothetical protein